MADAFTPSRNFTQINTTFSVDPHVQTVAGVPVASDASHGHVEIQATLTDGMVNGTVTARENGGFTVIAAPAATDSDTGYITRTATATKFLIGTEAGTNAKATNMEATGPRGAQLAQIEKSVNWQNVSTHAPARGATEASR